MGDAIGTIVKLLLASLIVGAIMMWLDLDALGILTWMVDAFRNMAATMGDVFHWAVGPALLGATIVVPVWLVALIARRARGRGR